MFFSETGSETTPEAGTFSESSGGPVFSSMYPDLPKPLI